MAQELLKREVLTYKDIENILGKRPNSDDTSTHSDLSQNRTDMVAEAAVVEEVSASKISSEERAALEAAVEKIKARRAQED
jgi:cell division protease FtsH